MPRESRGYEDDYRRGGVPPARRIVEEPVGRGDRHRADRGEARERARPTDDPPRTERPIRAERERERDRGDRDDPIEYAADPRIGAARGDPRANTAVRREEQRDVITAYRDPRTGQLRDAKTHELLDPAGRPVARPRDDYDDPMVMDRDEPPPRRREREREREREVYDSRAAPRDNYDDYGRGNAKPGYGMNEYFVDGTGIEREVIQHDICRYLGNDATVRRYTNKDGREGYIVRAYRALTSAQLEDLRQDSLKYRRQARSGRAAGIEDPRITELVLTQAGTYAEMRARDEPGYSDSMDVDMDYDPPAARGDRHRGDPEPLRGERADRHRLTPVTSGYGEPSYPAYALGTGQGPYGAAQVPRNAGNYSPQGGRAAQAQYPPTTYDTRTSGAATATIPMTQQVYKDPKTGQLVPIEPGYGGSYAPEPPRGGGRHGR